MRTYQPDHNGECLHCDEPADAHRCPKQPLDALAQSTDPAIAYARAALRAFAEPLNNVEHERDDLIATLAHVERERDAAQQIARMKDAEIERLRADVDALRRSLDRAHFRLASGYDETS